MLLVVEIVCLSITSQSSIKTAEWIELVFFGMEATLDLSYVVFEGNLNICENKGTSLRNDVPKSVFRKFCNCMLTVASVVNLGGRLV